MKESIAILWDVENVTPSADSFFVNGLIDYASEIGKISVATAYGDWTKQLLNNTAESLADNAFEMIHVPKSKKNSSDITLITHAIELIYQYPHIKTFILVTGDADFRPLLLSLRKHGITTIIICDAKSASEDLLILADSYKDYREIIPDDSSEDDSAAVEDQETPYLSFEESVALLKETIQMMQTKKKTTSLGAVKVRLKLLSGNFNEKALNLRSWKHFVLKAARSDKSIKLKPTSKDIILELDSANQQTSKAIKVPFIISTLLEAIYIYANKAKPWVPYSRVSQHFINNNVDIRKYKFNRINKLIEAAEKRGLVETRNKNFTWTVKLTKEGKVYCE